MRGHNIHLYGHSTKIIPNYPQILPLIWTSGIQTKPVWVIMTGLLATEVPVCYPGAFQGQIDQKKYLYEVNHKFGNQQNQLFFLSSPLESTPCGILPQAQIPNSLAQSSR